MVETVTPPCDVDVEIVPPEDRENVFGDENGTVLVGSDANNLILGLEENDLLIGRGGDNLMRGNMGDDTLSAQDGNDTLIGGEGDDVMRGNKGADIYEGGGGADTFVFHFGNDFRTETDDDIVLDYDFGTDMVSVTAPDSYQFDVFACGDHLIVDVETQNGVDRGSITFLDLAGLITSDLEDLTVDELSTLLNSGLVA